MPATPTLAAVLIARDEEHLPATLASVAFADEVVVVDGFGPRRDAAIALARSSWILSIEAREIVSPELAAEIRARLSGISALGPGAPAAFRVPVRLEFLGRVLRYGRDTVVRPIRLFHREKARLTDDAGAGRESVLVTGEIDALDAPILHRTYRDLTAYLDELDRETTLAAASRPPDRARGALLLLDVAREFFDRAVLRLGILDGTPGLTWAALSTARTLVKELKIAERSRLRP